MHVSNWNGFAPGDRVQVLQARLDVEPGGHMSKGLTVELMGAARIVAGRGEVSLSLRADATWGEAVAAVGRAAPELVGEVITKNGRDLLGSYTLMLGGRDFVRDLDEKVEPPEDGRVTLMDFSDL